MRGEPQNILRPVPQSWNQQRDRIEALKQILTKGPRLGHCGQIFIGRSKNADVNTNRVIPTCTLKLFFLQGAQDLALSLRAHIPDFIRQ